jgi:hypothetical protein
VSLRHPDAALFYDPERWDDRNIARFDAGDPRVRFEPCGGDQRTTQFKGAFLVRGPARVPVEVRAEGGTDVRDPLVRRRRLRLERPTGSVLAW